MSVRDGFHKRRPHRSEQRALVRSTPRVYRDLVISARTSLLFPTHRDGTSKLIWIPIAIVVKSLMPVHGFHLEIPISPETVIERVRAAVRNQPQMAGGLKESFREIWNRPEKEGPPFRGKVCNRTFRISQVVRGRNSFMPLVWGRVDQTPTGARLKVTILMHPLVLVLVSFWLAMVGRGIATENRGTRAPLVVMFVFGAVLSMGIFFWEAAKAKRLLLNAVLSSSA